MPSPRRLLGWVALVGAVAALTAGCGDPNAGDAATVEFESFLAERPVEGYEGTVVRADNTLPFSGSLSVTMTALEPDGVDPDDYLEEMASVAEQVCAFSPEADVSVEFGFGLGAYSTPLPCPGESSEERLADAARLLAEVHEVPGVESIQYGFSGTLDVVASPGADPRKVGMRVERVADRHTVALGDEDPRVSVTGPVAERATG